jgi:hypothetical protein
MKTYLFILIFLVSEFSIAQKEVRKTLSSSPLGWEINQVIRDAADTNVYFYMGFQNMKYQYITDIWSLYFISKSEMTEFATKLNEFALLGKENVSETIGDYKLQIYDFSNGVYITDKEGKYTMIPKKKAIKLAEEILANAYLLRSN